MYDLTDDLEPDDKNNYDPLFDEEFPDQAMALAEIDRLEAALYDKFLAILPSDCDILFKINDETDEERDQKRFDSGTGGLAVTGYYGSNVVLTVGFQCGFVKDAESEKNMTFIEFISISPVSNLDQEFDMIHHDSHIGNQVDTLCDSYNRAFSYCFNHPELSFNDSHIDELITSPSIILDFQDSSIDIQKQLFREGLIAYTTAAYMFEDEHIDVKNACTVQNLLYTN
jgi:hypothetical protein